MLSEKENSILDKAEDAILRQFETYLALEAPLADATFEALMDGLRSLDRICRMKYREDSFNSII